MELFLGSKNIDSLFEFASNGYKLVIKLIVFSFYYYHRKNIILLLKKYFYRYSFLSKIGAEFELFSLIYSDIQNLFLK